MACTHCARQLIWSRTLFKELGFAQNNPTTLFCDNKGTVSCTHDPHSHSQMKHIDIRAHYIRDCVNMRAIDVHHISGVDNPSDLLTKPLNTFTPNGLRALGWMRVKGVCRRRKA
jgi:hypothetical protein